VAATVGVGAALASANGAAAGTTAVTASPSTATGAATSTSTASAAAPAAATSAAATASAATATKLADGTYTGASEWTKWGNYQVQVTIQNGKIVSVKETQAPTDGRSVSINDRAQPVLESEAIAAQSAKINAVSGATYTSRTYKASLQSALDAATKAAQAAA
jgi:uncharacterized protein with FMN-binding domain